MRPAISSVSKRYGAGVRNQARNYTTTRQVDYATKNRIIQSGNPILGPEKPPRYIGSGVQGQGNLPSPLGPRAGNIPGQTGGGQVAKAQNPQSGQKTTGTKSNPYGSTKPPGQSPKDALTNALLQKILSDRKEGQKAITRDPQTKKISEVDLEKAKLDEKTKQELSKLSETIKNDAKEMNKSIDDFQKRFEQNLKGPEATDKGKELDGILDEVKDNLRVNEEGKVTDKDGNEVGSRHYNPQGLMDAAEKLQEWIDNPDNASELAKYGENGQELLDLNDQIQQVGGKTEEYVALVENNPGTVLRSAEQSAENADAEAGRLRENLEEASSTLNEGDTNKLNNFLDKMETAMDTLNPEEGKIFDADQAEKDLNEMRQSFNDLKETAGYNNTFAEAFNGKDLERSFQEVSDLGARAIDGQRLARKMEPDPAKYERAATEYVKGDDGVDATWAEHRTAAEREADIKASINDPEFLEKSIAEFNKSGAEEQPSKPKVENPSEATSRLGVNFDDDEVETPKATDDNVQSADEQTTTAPEQVDAQVESALDNFDATDVDAIDKATSRSDATSVDLEESTDDIDQELEDMTAELEEEIDEMLEEIEEDIEIEE